MNHCLRITILTSLFALGTLLQLKAQNELDFATKFLQIHAADSLQLQCSTVSPTMMERILDLKAVEESKDTRNLLEHIKTIQIVVAPDTTLACKFYEDAMDLAQKNTKRYRKFANDDRRSIFMRKHDDLILEIVLLSKLNNTFSIVSVTGNMDMDFLHELSTHPKENKED